MRWRIAGGALDVAIADAMAREPTESCGYLLGRRRAVTTYLPCLNAATDTGRDFEIDALEQLRAADFADEHRLQVLGIAHSHPAADATLSPTDITTASNTVFAGWLWLVLSLRDACEMRMRAYTVAADSTVREIDLKIF